MSGLNIAVTGLNATDNPAPGVPVIRSIRAGATEPCRILGFSYDPLDPGNYMDGVADGVFLVPYPSEGADELRRRIEDIHSRIPIDVLIPTLDAELPTYLKLREHLTELGISTFLPTDEQLKLRSKAKLNELGNKFDISVPNNVSISDQGAIAKLDREFKFPVMVKGQFYDAEIAYSPMEVEGHFRHIRAKWGLPVVVQEFIAGDEYDVVAVGDGKGGVIGAVPMRKMQLTDKGKAWGGITIHDSRLDQFVKETIEALRWRGPCELEVMRSRDDGKLYLLEINPRFPAWVYLSVGAKRNLPWATVELALCREVEKLPPPEAGIMFLRHSYDQICRLEDYEALTTSGELQR